MAGQPKETRRRYRHFLTIPTRWMDNDIYGHVNNVTYYSYFDTAANAYLVEAGGFDPQSAPVIGVVVESMCQYKSPLAFPDVLEAGLRVGKLGTSSVRYEIGIFGQGADEAAAFGRFVHVFVGRQDMKPVPIPPPLRAAFEKILVVD